jgi:hypothetical protein
MRVNQVEKFEGYVQPAAEILTSGSASLSPATLQYLYTPSSSNSSQHVSTQIAKGGQRVGTWRMAKTDVTAGDTLKALFETTDAALNCYAVSAALLQHEEATEEKGNLLNCVSSFAD